jgi:chemotaxis response regulator CheB
LPLIAAGPRVVIADDHGPLRRLCRRILEEDGFVVVGEAVDGEQAVEITGRLHPDVLVLDLRMPRMDGWSALPIIASRCPATMILVWSATLERDEEPRLQAAGAYAWRSKDDLTRLGEQILAEFTRFKTNRGTFGQVQP